MGLIAIIFLNSVTRINQVSERTSKLSAVLRSPWDPAAHVALATLLRQEGYLPAARQELLVAADQNPNVLGANTSIELLDAWEDEPRQLAEALSFWQQLTNEKPDYRDAFLQLALVAYQQGNMSEARAAAARALALDPTSPLVLQMLGITRPNQ